MPTVHEEEGCQFIINTNDHLPRHVHVKVSGHVIVVSLAPSVAVLRETNASAADIQKVQRLTLKNRSKLRRAWNKIHKPVR